MVWWSVSHREPSPRVCIIFYPECVSCSDSLIWVGAVVLNEPPARHSMRLRRICRSVCGSMVSATIRRGSSTESNAAFIEGLAHLSDDVAVSVLSDIARPVTG